MTAARSLSYDGRVQTRTCRDAKGKDVLLRPWGTDDSVTELTEMLHRAYAALAARGLRFEASWQDDAWTARRLANGEPWVAVVEGKIVGTVLFCRPGASTSADYFARPGVATFHQFAVDPASQGRGIASLLLETAEDLAREAGAAELALDTAQPAEDLIALYRRRGFEVVDRVQWPTVNYPSVVMSKRLGEESRG